TYSDLTIIIPTLNEEETITLLLQEIEKNAPQCHVIVADDGSTDKTRDNVLSFKGSVNIYFLNRVSEPIHGLTISVLEGIKRTTTQYFLVMDADLQHPPEEIPKFYTYLSQGADLVVGERKEVVGEWPFHRKLISYLATWLGSLSLILRHRNRVNDIMSGFFASKTDIWKEIINQNYSQFTLRGYKILFDFLKIYPKKLNVEHVKYVFGTRNHGSSKINKKIIWLFFKSLF
ncbi:MAG: glycosyltransferase, partial [Candidatus Heimdallarchaeaceae archaeon]